LVLESGGSIPSIPTKNIVV